MLYDAIHLVICVTTFSGTIHLVVSDTIHSVICVTFSWHDSFSYLFGCLRRGGALIDVAPGLVDNFGIRTGLCAFPFFSHLRSGVNMCVHIYSQIYFCCICTRGSSSAQPSQCPTPGHPPPRSSPAPPHPTPTMWGWGLGWGIGVGYLKNIMCIRRLQSCSRHRNPDRSQGPFCRALFQPICMHE